MRILPRRNSAFSTPASEGVLTPTATTFGDKGTYNQTANTISGLSTGAADANRWLYIVVGYLGDSTTLNSAPTLLVDGSSTGVSTVVQSHSSAGVTGQKTVIFKKNQTTGTTADFNFSLDGAESWRAWGVSIYRLISPTEQDTASDLTGTAGATLSLDVNTTTGGLVLGGSMTANETGSPVWTGVTQDASTDILTNEFFYSASVDNISSSETPRTVNFNLDAAGNGSAAVVSFSS